VMLKNFRMIWHVFKMVAFCSCIKVLGGRSSVLNALCSVFGITPVDDKTIGMVRTVSILHWVFISNASSLYFVSFTVCLACRL
jgi:hypothetical protein